MSMSPAPLQIASLIKAGMSREPSMEAGTTDWQASGILVARLDKSTLIFCAAIGGSDDDATRIRISRLVLRFSPKVLHPAPVARPTKVNRSITARPVLTSPRSWGDLVSSPRTSRLFTAPYHGPGVFTFTSFISVEKRT